MPLDPDVSLPLLKFLLLFLLIVFLPLAGLITAGSTVSCIYALAGRRDRDEAVCRLAAAIARGILLSRGTGLLLVLAAALMFLVAFLAYDLPQAAGRLGLVLLILLTAGLGLLNVYKIRPDRGAGSILAAGAALPLLVTALFLLANAETLLLHPENLPLFPILPDLLISWTGTTRFLSLTLLSFALAAATLPYLGGKGRTETERLEAAGRQMLLAVLLLWPTAVLFELMKFPAVALSEMILALAGLEIAIAAAGFLLLLGQGARGGGTTIPVLVLSMFVVWIVQGHVGRENALGGPAQVSAAAFGPFAARPAPVPPAGPPAAPAPEPTAEAGKEVFERVCSACHRFDQRLVGPPLAVVVPKYQGRADDLKAFIRDPAKVDPEYPAMPKLGLSEEEIAAVAAWLLEEVGK